jgi:transcriptional regulator with XRE-family HTH domain
MSTEKYVKSVEFRNLAKNLKKIRRSKKFGTFRQMAATLGIVHQYMSDIVSGRREPSDRLVDSMAHTFNIPREKLLSEEDFPIVAEGDAPWNRDKRRELLEKVKRLIATADDGTINALLNNVDEFQSGSDARRELEAFKKKK